MSQLKVAVIGTGRRKEKKDAMGYAMAYEHADAYQALESCKIVACADIVEENAQNFADKYGGAVFTDYKTMLAEAAPDMVSICTWMHLHEPMVLDAIGAGVKAIHCEKPMADSWGGAKRMAQAAKDAGVQLTFNHQRRYGAPYVMAKQMLEAGEIGEVMRHEVECGNIYDSGTHWIDMLSFFNGEVPAKWVLGQIDYRKESLVFGAHCENQQVVLTEYENGVPALIMTGVDKKIVGAFNKIIGTKGLMLIGVHGGAPLCIRRNGETDWTDIDTNGESIHGPGFIQRAIADVVNCLQSGKKCQLDAQNALIATEIIFGAYESSRRRGRVDFPLDIEDNPLRSMVESGDLKPEKE